MHVQHVICAACDQDVPKGDFCDQCGARLIGDGGTWLYLLLALLAVLAVYAVGALSPMLA